MNVAFMSGVDDRSASEDTTGAKPVYNILRLSRDLGAQSRLAMTYTDKIDGDFSNRVLSFDGRAVTTASTQGRSSSRWRATTCGAP